MKCIINHQVVLSREPEGPLKDYIRPFLVFVSALGYGQFSLHRQVLLAACFSRWLKEQGVVRRCIRSAHLPQYLEYRARQVKPHRGDTGALKRLMDFLRDEGAVPAEKMPVLRLTSAERCARAYEQYLREARALAEATVANYLPVIERFLSDRFGDGSVNLARLSADDVVGFVQRQAPRLHQKRAKLMTTALRSFLNYARYGGKVTLDLAAAVPTVPNWSMSSIPRGIAVDQVRRLLDSIDRHTGIGRRDYAILLLLARLGLRSSEVVFLQLDDIDWNTGTVIVCGKGGRHHEFPLPLEVGEAIAAYLQDGRPPCASRRVFLRARAPIRGFGVPGGIGSMVRHSIERAGVEAPTHGAHQFRHGLATEMLRQGSSLGEIGDVLGHRHPQTTKIYTKVDLEALRGLALPWPGGVQ